jgi:hypothetical protein
MTAASTCWSARRTRPPGRLTADPRTRIRPPLPEILQADRGGDFNFLRKHPLNDAAQ